MGAGTAFATEPAAVLCSVRTTTTCYLNGDGNLFRRKEENSHITHCTVLAVCVGAFQLVVCVGAFQLVASAAMRDSRPAARRGAQALR